MRLLIDGYNLLHATDLFGAGDLAGTLRGSREALVEFLVRRLDPRERKATLVIFDAADAPPGLPDRYELEGVQIRFARGYPDADTLIEEVLEPIHGAKHLTVVSGDRRVQRAARSSGARWIDSTAWFAELGRRPVADGTSAKQPPSQAVGSNAEWIAAFSDGERLAQIQREAAEAPPPAASPTSIPTKKSAEKPPRERPTRLRKQSKKRRPPLSESGEKPSKPFGTGLADPFPPGYGEDLLSGGPEPPGDE